MPLPSPVAQLPDFGALAQQSQSLSKQLMSAAWARSRKNNQEWALDQAPANFTLGSTPMSGSMAQSLASYGPAPSTGTTDLREMLAKTIDAEAGAESFDGQLAVGAVIGNRLKSGRWGSSMEDVIMAPGQFSAWNGVTGYAGGEGGLDMAQRRANASSYQVADMILSGRYQDPTNGALNYYNPDSATPKWGQQAGGDWTRIGNHIFGHAN